MPPNAEDRFYRQIIARAWTGKGEKPLLVTSAGGVASGKSYTLEELKADEHADLVLDTQLRQGKSAARKINHALAHGWRVQIYYVQRPFDLVASGAIHRGWNEGRWGSVRELPTIHREVQRGVADMVRRFSYHPDVTVFLLLNQGTKKNPMPAETLDITDVSEGGRWYNGDEESNHGIVTRELEQAGASGKYPESFLAALAGDLSPAAVTGKTVEGWRRAYEAAQQADARKAAQSGQLTQPTTWAGFDDLSDRIMYSLDDRGLFGQRTFAGIPLENKRPWEMTREDFNHSFFQHNILKPDAGCGGPQNASLRHQHPHKVDLLAGCGGPQNASLRHPSGFLTVVATRCGGPQNASLRHHGAVLLTGPMRCGGPQNASLRHPLGRDIAGGGRCGGPQNASLRHRSRMARRAVAWCGGPQNASLRHLRHLH